MSSCEFKSFSDINREIFFSNLKVKIFSSHKVVVSNKNYFNNNIEVGRPKNTWQNILKTYVYDEEGRELSFCLNYKVPLKGSSGELSYFTSDRYRKCPLIPEKKSAVFFKEIKSLKLYLKDSTNKKKKLKAYTLQVDYKVSKVNESFKVPFINLKKSNLIFVGNKKKFSYKNKKYSSSTKSGKVSGLTFLLNSKVRDDGFFISSDYMYGEKKLTACHKVEKNCKESLAYQCERCTGSWFEVVDFNCPQGGSKFCGRANCGSLNQPACPRGVDHIGIEYNDVCFDGSPAGICEEGLTPVCIGDKYLVCK